MSATKAVAEIVSWIDRALDVKSFDDVSNNGLQIARTGGEVSRVAFAVDGSLASVRGAAAAGAQLLVVHHGISWGGGIKRLVAGEYAVVKAAMDADLALAAYHLPLDANKAVGNNWEIARFLGLTGVKSAFSYHGNVIGVTGRNKAERKVELGRERFTLPAGKIGVCSGGAGEFATAAAFLGCRLYITGEASWGDVIAAENVGMPLVQCGHYETETFGVNALERLMKEELGVETVFIAHGYVDVD